MELAVSIVIPTRNRVASLSKALQSLFVQQFEGNYELIVVDNGSSDGTRSVAERGAAERPQFSIRYFYEPVPGLLSGRHRGALEAKCDLLIFVDDDIEADPHWLQAFKDAFEDRTVQMVSGPSLPLYEVTPPDWLGYFWRDTPYGGRMCTWLSLLDIGDCQV